MKNKTLFFSFILIAAASFFGCANQSTEISYRDSYADKDTASVVMPEEEKTLAKNIYVSIQGAVLNPGVYVMPEGSRVYELVNKAGGVTATARTEDINMVFVLEDGMQLIIPSDLEAEEQYIVSDDLTSTGSATSGESSGLININTASLEELTTLPGIGDTRAKAIIAFRDNGGVFETPEDIMKVNGIKAGIYEALKDQICVK